MKLEFSEYIFEKYSNIEFHKNLSSGSRVVPCEKTDMTEANSFSQFLELFSRHVSWSKLLFMSKLKTVEESVFEQWNPAERWAVQSPQRGSERPPGWWNHKEFSSRPL